jgi:hypothetical protein
MKDKLYKVVCGSGFSRLIWGVDPQEALEQMTFLRKEKRYDVFEVDLHPHNQDTFAKLIWCCRGVNMEKLKVKFTVMGMRRTFERMTDNIWRETIDSYYSNPGERFYVKKMWPEDKFYFLEAGCRMETVKPLDKRQLRVLKRVMKKCTSCRCG